MEYLPQTNYGLLNEWCNEDRNEIDWIMHLDMHMYMQNVVRAQTVKVCMRRNKERKRKRNEWRKIEIKKKIRTMLLDCLVLPTGSKCRDFLRRVWNTLPSSVATRSVRAGASCDKSVLLISILNKWSKKKKKLSGWKVKRLWERVWKKSKLWKVERVRASSGNLLQKHGLININTTQWSLYTSIHFSTMHAYVRTYHKIVHSLVHTREAHQLLAAVQNIPWDWLQITGVLVVINRSLWLAVRSCCKGGRLAV